MDFKKNVCLTEVDASSKLALRCKICYFVPFQG
jgi:hypothetical protein